MAMSGEPFAWYGGCWQPSGAIMLRLTDIGVLQGVVLVERLRTCNSRLLDVDAHLDRLWAGCRALGIQIPEHLDLRGIVAECVPRNLSAFGSQDFSIVVLVTPGEPETPPYPTMIVHPQAIDWNLLANWYQHGQVLGFSAHRSIPAECWSPQIKTRSRLNYFLADSQVKERFGATANALMQDHTGGLTETSNANLLIVEGRTIVSAPQENILQGVSLARTMRLADKLGYETRYEPISVSRAHAADEMLLCGTTGCFWPVSKLDDHNYPSVNGECYRQVSAQWKADVEFDYVAQAIDIAQFAS